MRFLWILDRVENPASANALLASRLAAQLLAAGHSVDLLELWDGQTPPPRSAHRCCTAYSRLCR